MIERQKLVNTLDSLLEPERFKDYGPNGLQVEGRGEIKKIVSGVTACLALIEAAVAAQADAMAAQAQVDLNRQRDAGGADAGRATNAGGYGGSGDFAALLGMIMDFQA